MLVFRIQQTQVSDCLRAICFARHKLVCTISVQRNVQKHQKKLQRNSKHATTVNKKNLLKSVKICSLAWALPSIACRLQQT